MNVKKVMAKPLTAMLMVISCLAMVPASAAVLYQFTGSGDYASVRTRMQSTSVYVWVAEETRGAVKVARLIYSVYVPGVGGKNWVGDVPATALTGAGTGQLAVDIDTCTVKATAGCGPVNLIWKTTGDLNDQYAGHTMNHDGDIITDWVGSSSYVWGEVSGSVVGTALNAVGGGMGKYNQATVIVKTVN